MLQLPRPNVTVESWYSMHRKTHRTAATVPPHTPALRTWASISNASVSSP